MSRLYIYLTCQHAVVRCGFCDLQLVGVSTLMGKVCTLCGTHLVAVLFPSLFSSVSAIICVYSLGVCKSSIDCYLSHLTSFLLYLRFLMAYMVELYPP